MRLRKNLAQTKISNFSSMEHDEYVRRAMFRADLREQLRYAEDKGIGIGRSKEREELLALLRQGYSVDEAERMLAKRET